MMGARTASAQLGYMLGAAGGGLVLAVAGFGTLGFVLFGGMLVSALLMRACATRAAAATPERRHPEPACRDRAGIGCPPWTTNRFAPGWSR